MPGAEELVYEVFLALGLALIVGRLFEELFARLGTPPVLGDLVAGLILGKTLLCVFPTTDIVKTLSWFGISILLFYAGLETRYREFIRNLPVYGLVTAGEVIAAFSIGYLVGRFFGYTGSRAYFIGTILVATSVSLSVRALMEIGKLSSLEGRTILGIAVLDDLAALIIIVAGISLAKSGTFSVLDMLRVVVVALTTWLATVFILHKASNNITKFAVKLHVEGSLLAIILGCFATLAYLMKYVGISYLVAAYATGLAFSEARGIRRIAENVKSLAMPFSVLFFMMTAAAIDLKTVVKPEYMIFYILMLSAAFAGKLIGGGLTSFLVGYPLPSAVRVAVGLFPRAEFCVVAAYFAVSGGILGPEAYLAALLIVLATNFLTPPLLKVVYLKGPEVTTITPRWSRLISRIRTKLHGSRPGDPHGA